MGTGLDHAADSLRKMLSSVTQCLFRDFKLNEVVS